jgi:pimeloyl-ACP methyl ester carboxylesterase
MYHVTPASPVATAVLALVLLGSCAASPPPAPDPLPAPTTSVVLEDERDVQVGSHHFRAQCAGRGPSVLLVSDYAESADGWESLPTRLGAFSRTCVYDRLGVSRSDPAPALQDFETIAADLDGVVTQLGLHRPIVLVSAGLGSAVGITWAKRHGRDARGLVLLSPYPPGVHERYLAALPGPDPTDPELGNFLFQVESFEDPARNVESLDPESWVSYDRTTGVEQPLWVLEAGTPATWPSAVDGAAIERLAREATDRLVAGSPHATRVVVPGSVGWISHDRPDLVVRAVREALAS